MYRSPDYAFGALDFSGLGYITEKAFLESHVVVDRVPYSKAQIREYFKENNLFSPGT